VSLATTDDPAAFERANYLRTLHSWTTPDELFASRAVSSAFGEPGSLQQ
jgi:hypothetical protein